MAIRFDAPTDAPLKELMATISLCFISLRKVPRITAMEEVNLE
jgi:hypothetical protein